MGTELMKFNCIVHDGYMDSKYTYIFIKRILTRFP